MEHDLFNVGFLWVSHVSQKPAGKYVGWCEWASECICIVPWDWHQGIFPISHPSFSRQNLLWPQPAVTEDEWMSDIRVFMIPNSFTKLFLCFRHSENTGSEWTSSLTNKWSRSPELLLHLFWLEAHWIKREVKGIIHVSYLFVTHPLSNTLNRDSF